jgi:hypothetical protein
MRNQQTEPAAKLKLAKLLEEEILSGNNALRIQLLY